MSQDLAALRASAERGMMEDAEPAHATARERLLQLYRDAWIDRGHLELCGTAARDKPMGEEDLAGIEWIASLAAAGHLGASRLLDRSMQRWHLENLYRVAVEEFERLAQRVPPMARFLVWQEFRKQQPDLARIELWLPAGGETGRGLRALFALLRDSGIVPGQQDLDMVREALYDSAESTFNFGMDEERLLMRLASHRLAESSPEAARRGGRELLERMAARGSPEASEYLFTEGFREARHKPTFMQQWFASGRRCVSAAVLPCLQFAAAMERGGAGREPNLEEAMRWYERALGHRPRHASGKLNMEFCYAVATALDRRWRTHKLDDAELAMKWHERSLDLGDERCLDTWITTCAKGEMGLASDPAAALERAQRFRASGVDMDARRWRFMSAVRAVQAAAEGAKDSAIAAQWRELAALLEGREMPNRRPPGTGHFDIV